MSDFFKRLKKNRTQRTQKLKDKIESDKSDSGNTDPNEWRLTRDKSNNGFAIIRFLPATEADILAQPDVEPEEVSPWVLIYNHGFKVNGRWFIENCPRTLGNDCPVCEKEKQAVEDGPGAWDSERDAPHRKQYTDRKGGKNYWSNIHVVKDSANPENEGKVFKFRYGAKIYEKVTAPMFPEFEDEVSMDPFCPWEGANFKLKVQKKDGYINYDRSGFADPSAISDDDDDIEKILGQCHQLQPIVSPDKFLSYDKMDAKYEQVISGKTPGRNTVDDDSGDIPFADKDPVPAPRNKPVKKEEQVHDTGSKDDDDTQFKADVSDSDSDADADDMAYFNDLLDDD